MIHTEVFKCCRLHIFKMQAAKFIRDIFSDSFYHSNLIEVSFEMFSMVDNLNALNLQFVNVFSSFQKLYFILDFIFIFRKNLLHSP